MVENLYQNIIDNPGYNKVIGNNYLIVEYKCPIETRTFQLLAEQHFILYIVSGRKDWIVSGKKLELHQGDAVFFRKGAYTTHQHFDTDHCVLFFFMNDEFIRDFIRDNRDVMLQVKNEKVIDQAFELDVNESLSTLFHSVLGYLKTEPRIPQNLIEIKFRELLFNIVVLNPNHQSLSQFFFSILEKGKSSLEQVMNRHFRYDLSLEEFAELCDRSLSTFKRDFRKSFNQSPGTWIKEKRLDYAHSLLMSSDMNINEICFECGFQNTAHFNRAFREKYKLPPNQYKINHNKKHVMLVK